MKCAVVTGGSRGIGRAICKKLAVELGYHVLINYQGNEEAAKETLAALKDEGATGEIIKFNVGDLTDVKQALQRWSDHHPEAIVEVIVNNAGIAVPAPLIHQATDDFRHQLEVNLVGQLAVTQAVLLCAPTALRSRHRTFL